MASPENRHCANCIDALSFPVCEISVKQPVQATGRKQHRVVCITRSSAIAEGPRDASCQWKYCQLRRNSAETTYTTSPDQIDGMKLEI